MGVVYLASRNSDDLPVAIKIARPRMTLGPTAEKRFLREIDLVRELQHAHIVCLLECGVAGGVHYSVMEYCSGGSLAGWIHCRAGRVPVPVAASLLLQCLDGLECAHQHGVVHRDLKPQIILLHQYRARWIAKLADFGLAKSFELAGYSSLTTT